MALALACAALMTGCADIAPTVREPEAGAKSMCYERIDLAGRFSVQYRKDGRDESAHGSFRWQQDGGSARVELLSPLGQTLATIDVTPESATLTSAGQAPRIASDANALAVMLLGWPLPVTGLRDWLQGCTRDARGKRYAVASEGITTPDGWRIAYPVWEADGSVRRPKRIDLQHKGNSAVTDIALRLVLDEWQPRR